MPSSTQDPWQQAVRLLTAADRSAHEIRVRLTARGHAAQAVDQTIRRLHAAGYLDDARVADNAARAGMQRGYGSERVRAKLLARAIDATTVETAIESWFTEEAALARAALHKRYRKVPNTPGERAKAGRFLTQRGFPETVVSAIVGGDSPYE